MLIKNQPFSVNLGQGLSLMIGLPTIMNWENKSRPQSTKVGTLGFNTQTNSLEYWDGTDWYAAKMGKV